MRSQIPRPRQNSLIPASHRTYSGFTRSPSGWQVSPQERQYPDQSPANVDLNTNQGVDDSRSMSFSNRKPKPTWNGHNFALSNRRCVDRKDGDDASTKGSDADWYTSRHNNYRDTTSEIISLYGNGPISIYNSDNANCLPAQQWTTALPPANETESKYRIRESYQTRHSNTLNDSLDYSNTYTSQAGRFGARPYPGPYETERATFYPQTRHSSQVGWDAFPLDN